MERRPEAPPAAASFYAVATKHFPKLDRQAGGPISVRVNGGAVESGAQEALTLALLGVTADPHRRPPEPPEFEDSFWRFVSQHWPILCKGQPGVEQFDEWAAAHQEGTGWKLEVWVESSATAGQKLEASDLAYCDPMQVRRQLTFTVREWNTLSYKQWVDQDRDPSRNRTSKLITHVEDLEFGGAVGSWYSGIDQDEIDATRKAANAIFSARANFERAFEEITISMEVIKAAWGGDRAEAALEKLRLESEIVGAIRDVTHGWEDFTQDVVRQQGLAKQHDDDFKAAVKREIAITIVASLISFGVAAVGRAAWFTLRLAKWAQEIELLRKAIQSSRMATFNRLRNTAIGIRAMRASRLGAIEVTATVTVDGATGHPITAGDLLTRFLIAAGLQGLRDVRLPTGKPPPRVRPTTTPTRGTPPPGPTLPAGARTALAEARARAAATRFQQRPELKLDQGAATNDALTQMFRRTAGGGRNVAPRPGQQFPLHSRAAAAEIRTITEWARRSDVVLIRAVPSASGSRTPDFVVYIRRPNGSVVPTRVEITTATGAPARYVRRGHVWGRPTTVDVIEQSVLRKATSTAANPSQLEVPLPGVPPGGTIAVHLPRLDTRGPETVAAAMRRLGPQLAGRASVQRIEFYLPNQPPIVYVREPLGTYVLQTNLGPPLPAAPIFVPGGSDD